MIALHALPETVLPHHAGADPDRRTMPLEGRGGTYDEAMAALREQLTDGMRLIWVRLGLGQGVELGSQGGVVDVDVRDVVVALGEWHIDTGGVDGGRGHCTEQTQAEA